MPHTRRLLNTNISDKVLRSQQATSDTQLQRKQVHPQQLPTAQNAQENKGHLLALQWLPVWLKPLPVGAAPVACFASLTDGAASRLVDEAIARCGSLVALRVTLRSYALAPHQLAAVSVRAAALWRREQPQRYTPHFPRSSTKLSSQHDQALQAECRAIQLAVADRLQVCDTRTARGATWTDWCPFVDVCDLVSICTTSWAILVRELHATSNLVHQATVIVIVVEVTSSIKLHRPCVVVVMVFSSLSWLYQY
jgi:hypothetical protein